jgi:hypothetical protein
MPLGTAGLLEVLPESRKSTLYLGTKKQMRLSTDSDYLALSGMIENSG